jgi:putative tricarboxylic transport membrane protein
VRTNDAVSGLVLILLASLMIYLTASFPPFPGQKYGPSLFPRLLGGGIIVCGVLLVIQGLAGRRAGERWVTWAAWTREPWRVTSFLLMIGVILLYIFASDSIGFLPIAGVLLLALFLWFKVTPVRAVPIAVLAVFAINYFFAHLMRVPLPRGFLNSMSLPPWLMSIL